MEGLRRARAEHNLDHRMKVYLAPKVLIVDEFGIWPYDRESATAFFTLVSARYERGSIILTSNKGFGEWGELLGGTVSSPRSSWTGCFTTAMCSTFGAKATVCGRNGRQVCSPPSSIFPQDRRQFPQCRSLTESPSTKLLAFSLSTYPDIFAGQRQR